MEAEKLLRECIRMFDTLQYAYDLSYHTEDVSELCKKIRRKIKVEKQKEKLNGR